MKIILAALGAWLLTIVPLQAQGGYTIPITTPIPGYYAFYTDEQQILLNTQTGQAQVLNPWGSGNGRNSAPRWEHHGSRLAYYDFATLIIDDPFVAGDELRFTPGVFTLDDWLADGLGVLGTYTEPELTYDEVRSLRFSDGVQETILRINHQELLENGLGLFEIDSAKNNPVFANWFLVETSGLPLAQPADSEVNLTYVTFLYNRATGQRIYLSGSIPNPYIYIYGVWSSDGTRLYLITDNYLYEFSFQDNGTISLLSSGLLNNIYPGTNSSGFTILEGPLGISDLVLLRHSTQSDSSLGVRQIGRIVNNQLVEVPLVQLPSTIFNTRYVYDGRFHLTATEQERIALSCIIDVGPAARLLPNGQGRVTITDGSGTRLRSAPGVTGAILQTMADGTPFTVLQGPYCMDSYKWWQVQLGDGTIGWAAEGSSSGYFLEPVIAPTNTPTATYTPTPTNTPTLTPHTDAIPHVHADARAEPHHQRHVQHEYNGLVICG